MAVNIPKHLKSVLIQGLNGFDLCFINNQTESLQFINTHDMDIILVDESGWELDIHLKIDRDLKKHKKKTPVFLLAQKDTPLKKLKNTERLHKEELTPALLQLAVVRALENSKWAALNTQMEAPLHDPSTGLFNKHYLFMRLNEELERSRRYKFPVCVALITAEQWDMLTERYGSESTENVLKELGKLIQKNIRLSDIVCRYDEKHLGLLLPHTTVAESKVFWKRLSRVLAAQPLSVGNKNYMLSFKFGVLPITLKTEHVEDKLSMICSELGA
ncbi:diguanylate cyclase [bacterium]|nr:diguanylate cyclase [bacterium]